MTIRPKFLSQMSFTGMRDSLEPQTADPRKAKLLQNVYPQDEIFGGGTVGRPGFQLTENSQLGSSGKRKAQGGYQFTKLDGTEFTITIVGGQFYTYSWGSLAWTEVLTTANLTSSSITLDAVARCYFVTFSDKVLVSDGVHTPWLWNGTTNGGLTKLTNAPVFFGQPGVHYAKVFGIKAAERSAIVWSEEADATTGYEAGGFNNAWTLGQTDQEALFAIYPTNEVLYYFRSRSIGGIAGQVTTNFSNTGTREGVSETVGTESPASVIGHEGDVYFLDSDARPRMIRIGLGLVGEFWQDARQTIALLPRGQFPDVVAVDHTPMRLILFGVTGEGEDDPSQQLAISYSTGSPVFAGVFEGYSFTSLDMVKNNKLVPTMMHGFDGYVYDHGSPEGGLLDDELQSGTVAIEHIVEGTPLGFDTQMEKHFDQIDISFLQSTNTTGVTVAITTPYDTLTSDSFTLPGSFSLWDTALWDVGTWAVSGEVHVAIGLSSYGRWGRPRITHSVTGERFGLNGWTMKVYPDAADEAAA